MSNFERTLSLVERKKLQWAREKEELASLNEHWAKDNQSTGRGRYPTKFSAPKHEYLRKDSATSSPVRRSSLPPLYKNQNFTYVDKSDREMGGETSGYGSDNPNHSPEHYNNPQWNHSLGYESSSSGREDRPKWGDRGPLLAKFWESKDSDFDKDTPGWVKRGLEGKTELVVSNSSPAVSPEQDCMDRDRPNTGSSTSHTKTFIRGQNIHIEASELAERERKRQIALAHQEAIRQQLEEREQRRREEKERRLREEREEELRIEREKEIERQRVEREQRLLDEKLEREKRRKEAIQAALKLAEKEAMEQKLKQKALRKNMNENVVEKTELPRSELLIIDNVGGGVECKDSNVLNNVKCEDLRKINLHNTGSCPPINNNKNCSSNLNALNNSSTLNRSSAPINQSSTHHSKTSFHNFNSLLNHSNSHQNHSDYSNATLNHSNTSLNDSIPSLNHSNSNNENPSSPFPSIKISQNVTDKKLYDIPFKDHKNLTNENNARFVPPMCLNFSTQTQSNDNLALVLQTPMETLQNMQFAVLMPTGPSGQTTALPIAVPITIPTERNNDIREMRESTGENRAFVENIDNRVLMNNRAYPENRSFVENRVLTENRILTPTQYRNNKRLVDSATQTEPGDFKNYDNREKYIREKLSNLELARRRLRSDERNRENVEERPKWGANRPPTRYLKQSEKDPLYQRRKLRQKMRQIKVYDDKGNHFSAHSSDDSQMPSPRSYRKRGYIDKRHEHWRKEILSENIRVYQTEIMPLESDRDQIYYKTKSGHECCCTCRCLEKHGKEHIKVVDILKIEHNSPREHYKTEILTVERLPECNPANQIDGETFEKISALTNGLVAKQEKWEKQEKWNTQEKWDKKDKVNKLDKINKEESWDKSEKWDKPEKWDRPEKWDKQEKWQNQDKWEKLDNPAIPSLPSPRRHSLNN